MFLDLVKSILIAVLVLALLRGVVLFAAWSEERTAAAAIVAADAATPAPGPCVRHYGARSGGQRITFVQSCEAK